MKQCLFGMGGCGGLVDGVTALRHHISARHRASESTSLLLLCDYLLMIPNRIQSNRPSTKTSPSGASSTPHRRERTTMCELYTSIQNWTRLYPLPDDFAHERKPKSEDSTDDSPQAAVNPYMQNYVPARLLSLLLLREQKRSRRRLK